MMNIISLLQIKAVFLNLVYISLDEHFQAHRLLISSTLNSKNFNKIWIPISKKKSKSKEISKNSEFKNFKILKNFKIVKIFKILKNFKIVKNFKTVKVLKKNLKNQNLKKN